MFRGGFEDVRLYIAEGGSDAWINGEGEVTVEQMKELAAAIMHSSTLKTLTTADMTLGLEAVGIFAEALEGNRCLQKLRMVKSGIGGEGATVLAMALELNDSLTSISCTGSNIVTEGAAALALALNINTSLTTLCLGWNSIGHEGVAALAKALETNASLRTLDLTGNSLGDEGAVALAKALERNVSLATINFHHNGIGLLGAAALARSLESNSSLTTIYLHWNSLGDEGAAVLAKALERNASLKSIDLRNSIGDTGAAALGHAVEVNGSLIAVNLLDNEISEKVSGETLGRIETRLNLNREAAKKRQGAVVRGRVAAPKRVDDEAIHKRKDMAEEEQQQPRQLLALAKAAVDQGKDVAGAAGVALGSTLTLASGWAGALEGAERAAETLIKLQKMIREEHSVWRFVIKGRDEAAEELVAKCSVLWELMYSDSARDHRNGLRERKQQLERAYGTLVEATSDATSESLLGGDLTANVQELEEVLGVTEAAMAAALGALKAYYQGQADALERCASVKEEEDESRALQQQAYDTLCAAEAATLQLKGATRKAATVAAALVHEALLAVTEDVADAEETRARAVKLVEWGSEAGSTKAPKAKELVETALKAERANIEMLAKQAMLDEKLKVGNLIRGTGERQAHEVDVEKLRKEVGKAQQMARGWGREAVMRAMDVVAAARHYPEVQFADDMDRVLPVRLLQGRRLDDFTVEEREDRGGKQRTAVLRCVRDGRQCVLKYYRLRDIDDRCRLLQEAMLLAKLQHHGRVQVESIFVEDKGRDAYVEMPEEVASHEVREMAEEMAEEDTMHSTMQMLSYPFFACSEL